MSAVSLLLCAVGGASAREAAPVRVTPDNFARAETDRYFALTAAEGGFGKFRHRRAFAAPDRPTVVRPNRDTLYSSAIFDLDAGPVTIVVPDAGKRFLSLQVIDEDHYVPLVAHGAGRYTLTRDTVGTRYVMAAFRILADPAIPGDLEAVHALQDAIAAEQPGGPGRLELPAWDKASWQGVRDALIALGATLPDLDAAFGARGKVDPVRHLVASASAWGGNPERDATYINVTPAKNDGTTAHRLRVGAVPVDGFWSISVYNAKGYFEPGLAAYSINNLSATKDRDGGVIVRFGGCEAAPVNCLPIMPGWNYLVRLYRPRAEILDHRWTFPAATPVTENRGE
ncbi:MAG: DUF1254 domain-containing protein [Sphingopyxis sp.]|nr:DUF1254 domain-containing protein [Sphingopyxis sp.]